MISCAQLPELYKLGFDASDYAVPTNLIENAMTVLIYEVISDLIRQYKPHAIISTYPIYVSVISAVFTISRIRAAAWPLPTWPPSCACG